MTTTIRATFDGEVLRPREPLHLPPNTEVLLTIESEPAGEGPQGSSFLKLARSLRLDGPPDWSARLDEYLYGGDEGATADD